MDITLKFLANQMAEKKWYLVLISLNISAYIRWLSASAPLWNVHFITGWFIFSIWRCPDISEIWNLYLVVCGNCFSQSIPCYFVYKCLTEKILCSYKSFTLWLLNHLSHFRSPKVLKTFPYYFCTFTFMSFIHLEVTFDYRVS